MEMWVLKSAVRQLAHFFIIFLRCQQIIDGETKIITVEFMLNTHPG